MKDVLFIVGSQRENSFNKRLANEAAFMLEGRATVRMLSYGDIPLMNQDIEFPPPVEVARVRAELQVADGVWIVTPEYNFSYPGGLKNLLDWMSRPLTADDPERTTAFTSKKVTVSSAAGRSAGAGARGKLVELLHAMRADVMEEPQVGISLPGESFGSDAFALTDEQRSQLEAQVNAFLAFMGE